MFNTIEKVKIISYAVKILERDIKDENISQEIYGEEIAKLARMENDAIEYWAEQICNDPEVQEEVGIECA